MKRSLVVPGEDAPLIVPIALLVVGGVFATTAVGAAESPPTGAPVAPAPVIVVERPPVAEPAPAPALSQAPAPRVCAPLVVHFAIGASDGPASAHAPLERLAAFLVANPTARAIVEGHADAVGDELTNLRLSQRRASWVAARLTAAGASAESLTTRGLGAFSPVLGAGDPNKEGGEPVNRRVVVNVGGASACAPVPEEEIR